MKKSPVDFLGTESLKLRIENDVGDAGVGEAGGTAHSGVPEDSEIVVKRGESEGTEFFTGEFCQVGGRMAFGQSFSLSQGRWCDEAFDAF